MFSLIWRNSLAAILVDGAILEVSEALDIESGIEIVSGPKLEGQLLIECMLSRHLKVTHKIG